jgi:hypothetical protein
MYCRLEESARILGQKFILFLTLPMQNECFSHYRALQISTNMQLYYLYFPLLGYMLPFYFQLYFIISSFFFFYFLHFIYTFYFLPHKCQGRVHYSVSVDPEAISVKIWDFSNSITYKKSFR